VNASLAKPETYAQAVDDTHFAYGTLRNYASICARIPKENRNPKLRFHQIKHVACLEPHEQKAIINAAARAEHITGDEILEAVQKVTGKKTPTHESYEGEITSRILGRDCTQITILVSRNVEWEKGQFVTIKAR